MRITASNIRWSSRRDGPVWCVLLLSVCLGCDTFDGNRREVIARNSDWTITAVGNLEAHGPAFGRNLVRFEADHRGALYASGELYDAGSHDRSFALRYELREWAFPDVLRLSSRPRSHCPAVSLVIRNQARATIRWLEFDRDEIFLLLQLLPGTSRTLPICMASDYTIFVSGGFDTGQQFKARKDTLRFDQPVEIAIRDGDVHITGNALPSQ